MTRSDLEARLVAHAIVQPGRRQELLEAIDRNAVTVACWAIISQLAVPDMERVWCVTANQRRLADLAEAITVAQLLDWPSDLIIETIHREGWSDAKAPAAWERDLARATGVAA